MPPREGASPRSCRTRKLRPASASYRCSRAWTEATSSSAGKARRRGRAGGGILSAPMFFLIFILLAIFWQTLTGSFSAVSKPNFTSTYLFESSGRDLQDLHASAPLLFKISANCRQTVSHFHDIIFKMSLFVFLKNCLNSRILFNILRNSCI